MTTQVTSSGVPWNLDRIDQDNLPLDGKYKPPNNGKGVTVYVLDSGILPSHSEFGSRAEACFDALGGNGIDCTGHGTHVAAVVAGSTYGVANEAWVCGVKVVGGDCDSDGEVADVVGGIDWVANHVTKPAVATLSLNMYGEHLPLSHALDGFIELTGVTVVVAAGNMDDDACAGMPSSNEQVITVGATTINDTRWPSSNWGSCVDIFAPGAKIESAWIEDPRDTNVQSGTSEACPHVAGAAAILLAENGSLSHSTVKARILASATKDVLLFNQGNTTEAIEGTTNLMLRVGGQQPQQSPKEQPQPKQQNPPQPKQQQQPLHQQQQQPPPPPPPPPQPQQQKQQQEEQEQREQELQPQELQQLPQELQQELKPQELQPQEVQKQTLQQGLQQLPQKLQQPPQELQHLTQKLQQKPQELQQLPQKLQHELQQLPQELQQELQQLPQELQQELQPRPQELKPQELQQERQQEEPKQQQQRQQQQQKEHQQQQPPTVDNHYPISDEKDHMVIIEKPVPGVILIPDVIPLN